MRLLYPLYCIYCGTKLESLLVRNDSEQCPQCFKELRDLSREVIIFDKQGVMYYNYVDKPTVVVEVGYHQIYEYNRLRYKCNYCIQTSTRKYNMKRHIELAHNKQRTEKK